MTHFLFLDSKDAEKQSDSNRISLLTAQEKIKEASIQVANIKAERDQLNKQLQTDRGIMATVGSTITKMLWKSSKSEDVVKNFIDEDMARDFVVFSDLTLESFLETYSDELPNDQTPEFKFALSVLGKRA